MSKEPINHKLVDNFYQKGENRMKKLLFITIIFIFFFGWSAVPAKAAPPQPFYLEKVCDGSYGPGVCGITLADPLEQLAGGTITYFDHAFFFPNLGGIAHEASTILVTASDGSTANGHISWVLVNGKFSGHYTILPGTGSLAGLHASGRVDVISWTTFTFSFTGTYFVAP